MREISPAIGISVDEYIAMMPHGLRQLVDDIRREKLRGERKRPSDSLIDHSSLLTKASRCDLLNAVAALVDENYVGRAEMCFQFADLLNRALAHLQFPSRPVVGTAIYFDSSNKELYRWTHAWVRVGNEVIDGNADCLDENPLVPRTVAVAPYWGPITQTPVDRILRAKIGEALPSDVDVDETWWPELRQLLETRFVTRP